MFSYGRTLYQNLVQNKSVVLILLIIFFIFIFFRFYNLHLRIPFAWDQEQFSTQVRDILRDGKLTLLGPRVTDDRGFFLAPYFTYLLIPFFLLTNLHPQALTLFTVVTNLIFFFTSLFILEKLFGLKQSILFLLLWSINPLLIKYDTTPWWPILIPTGVMLIWFELYSIVKNPRNSISWCALGVTVGFFCNMHFQFVFIGVFAILFLISSFTLKIMKYWAGIIIAATSFMVMFAPLFLFDLRHEYLNYNLFVQYFSERVFDDLPYMHAWQPVFANVIKPWTGISHAMMTIFFLVMMSIIYIVLSYKKTGFIRNFYISSFVLLIITAIGFSLYGRRPSEYYFTYLLPFLFLGISDFLLMINKKYLIALTFALMIVLNAEDLQKSIQEDSGGLYYKDQAVQEIIPYSKHKLNVSYDMPLGLNNGYDYLLDHHGIRQTGDSRDPLIQLRIPPHQEDIAVKNIGVYIPSELR